MSRVSSITPHTFVPAGSASNPDYFICGDCGESEGAAPHWNPEYLQEFGPAGYHHWYYNTDVWRHVSFMGVYCAKNVLDLWNYQEIMWQLKPGLVIEFGTYAGGTALYLHWVMSCVNFWGNGPEPKVWTFDIDHSPLHRSVEQFSLPPSSLSAILAGSTSERARELFRSPYWLLAVRNPVMFILDSDHSKENVLSELDMIRDLTRTGDYVIVEDSNINGHPVLPDFGPGPWEAIEEYERRHPGDYEHDTARELKFGMTFNPRGYLRRK